MSLKLGKPKMTPPAPRKDTERDMRKAVVEDADKTEGKDRDLVHGDGGTLGMDEGEDLNRDDCFWDLRKA
ncbi:hypothetical protein [Bradyrhizobium sp. WSM2254]|uniref:hypothetical protein n=1 Tax=Bradyrhizobium sp. WSM2254 TaxID=1188263 RepID=UPI00048752BA|nr:hypothetical protein [Bradyrhizobium sp. WSM2254]